MPSFFSWELLLMTVLLLICDFHMRWSTRLVCLKLCVGFSIFDSVSFLLKFIFLVQQNAWTLTLRRHNSFQNYNNGIATHRFAARPVIFNLQQEVLKLSYICVSWSSAKTNLVTIFFKLEIEVLGTLNFLNSNF